jgi:hypothetical protein
MGPLASFLPTVIASCELMLPSMPAPSAGLCRQRTKLHNPKGLDALKRPCRAYCAAIWRCWFADLSCTTWKAVMQLAKLTVHLQQRNARLKLWCLPVFIVLQAA